MLNSLLRPALALTCVSLMAGSALAQERGTKEEAKAFAEAAAAHAKKVGVEKALKDFSTDKAAWTKKDLYVVAFDGAGNCIAHGANEKLIGKNLMDMKDQSGRLFTKAIIETGKANAAGGWTEYEWVHPVTKKLESKQTYSIKVADKDAIVAVGAYR